MAQPSRSVSLPIPLYFQPEDKAYCGPTAARMILAYFGIRKSLRAIVSGMPVSKRHGMFHTALGEYFLELGFSVTIKLFDPEFRCDFLYLEEPDVNKVIRRWCAKKPNNRFRASLRYFIDAGGVLIPRPVTEADIRDAMEKKHASILNINPTLLSGAKREGEWGHYVVPVRLTDSHITVNDPACGRMEHLIPNMMLALYRWSAAGIFISPK